MMKKRYKEVTDEERDSYIFDLLPFIDANEGYYVNQFIRMKSGRKISWNWTAFIFGPYWCMYRKMYALGIFNLLINVLIEILHLSIYVNMIYYAIFGMFANLIYLRVIEERLQEKQKMEEIDRVDFQTKNGGTSIMATSILVIVTIIFRIIVLLIQL